MKQWRSSEDSEDSELGMLTSDESSPEPGVLCSGLDSLSVLGPLSDSPLGPSSELASLSGALPSSPGVSELSTEVGVESGPLDPPLSTVTASHDRFSIKLSAEFDSKCLQLIFAIIRAAGCFSARFYLGT